MFDTLQINKNKETYPFLQWMDKFVMTEKYIRQARDAMYEFEAQISEISRIHRVPQSSKHHAEGPVMTYHLERMLATLNAICDNNADLMQIEEFVREKHLKNEIVELQEIICENAATMKAFIFAHDIAKLDCISFDAPVMSKGAMEGFSYPQKLSIKQLIDLYLKLLRAFEVENQGLDQKELCIAFSKEYQIKVSYKGHDSVAVSDKYYDFRSGIEDICRLTSRDREMLFLLIKEHIREISFFAKRPDGARYQVLIGIAQKAGLDSDDVLDCQLAALFLDAAAGSIAYENSKFHSDIEVVINMMKSEELALSDRKQKRIDRLEDKKKKDFKVLLESVGLGAQDVFEELNIPASPERAIILKQIDDIVKDSDARIEDSKLEILLPKINKARLLYSSQTR
jgi:hypothetical protein